MCVVLAMDFLFFQLKIKHGTKSCRCSICNLFYICLCLCAFVCTQTYTARKNKYISKHTHICRLKKAISLLLLVAREMSRHHYVGLHCGLCSAHLWYFLAFFWSDARGFSVMVMCILISRYCGLIDRQRLEQWELRPITPGSRARTQRRHNEQR